MEFSLLGGEKLGKSKDFSPGGCRLSLVLVQVSWTAFGVSLKPLHNLKFQPSNRNLASHDARLLGGGIIVVFQPSWMRSSLQLNPAGPGLILIAALTGPGGDYLERRAPTSTSRRIRHDTY